MVRRNGRTDGQENGIRRLEITHPMQALDPRSNHSQRDGTRDGNTNYCPAIVPFILSFFLGRDMSSRLFHITANISYRFCGANERYTNLN